jgi:putative transposase
MVDRLRSEREIEIANVLRPLGTKPLSRAMATRAAQLLKVHWTSIYRLRRRFLSHPVASSLKPRERGPKPGVGRLPRAVETVLDEVLQTWLPKQRDIAHPLKEVVQEVRQRCRALKLAPPSRNSVARRWKRLQEAEAMALAEDLKAKPAPGEFRVDAPLEVVQIDHTQADAFVVDPLFRRNAKRPWISIAIDVATRCVLAFYLSMDRPNAATVALLLTRMALPKSEWIKRLGVDAQWPMYGIPKTLHLDNAAEFHGKALKAGCAEYGIALMYRPPGQPKFGGHIERFNRTLMERLRALPGASAGSKKRSKRGAKPEQRARLTLTELERWVALEIAQRYHQSEHRGLMGATPAAVWQALTQRFPPRVLPTAGTQALRFVVHFLPLQSRTVQNNGLTIFHIRYWHPIFIAWRRLKRKVLVRYHPEDISRLYVSVDGTDYYEARYADLRRPRISLGEQRAVLRALRAKGRRDISERLIFKAIADQREIVQRASAHTRAVRRGGKARKATKEGAVPAAWSPLLPAPDAAQSEELDYSKPPPSYSVETW